MRPALCASRQSPASPPDTVLLHLFCAREPLPSQSQVSLTYFRSFYIFTLFLLACSALSLQTHSSFQHPEQMI